MNEDKLITTDSLLLALKDAIEDNKPISPPQWMSYAQRLNILSENDVNELIALEMDENKLLIMKMEEKPDMSVARAKIEVEATELHASVERLRAKLERIAEAVRLAKARAKLDETVMRGY